MHLSFHLESICLFIYLSVYLPSCFFYLSIDRSNLSIYLSFDWSICLSIYLPIYLSIDVPIDVPVDLSIYWSIFLYIDLSIYLSVYPSFHLSICSSINPSIHPSLSKSRAGKCYIPRMWEKTPMKRWRRAARSCQRCFGQLPLSWWQRSSKRWQSLQGINAAAGATVSKQKASSGTSGRQRQQTWSSSAAATAESSFKPWDSKTKSSAAVKPFESSIKQRDSIMPTLLKEVPAVREACQTWSKPASKARFDAGELRRLSIPGDGNCLFAAAAVGKLMWTNPENPGNATKKRFGVGNRKSQAEYLAKQLQTISASHLLMALCWKHWSRPSVTLKRANTSMPWQPRKSGVDGLNAQWWQSVGDVRCLFISNKTAHTFVSQLLAPRKSHKGISTCFGQGPTMRSLCVAGNNSDNNWRRKAKKEMSMSGAEGGGHPFNLVGEMRPWIDVASQIFKFHVNITFLEADGCLITLDRIDF